MTNGPSPPALPFMRDGALRPGPLADSYAALHQSPPFRDADTGLWVLAGYDDVRQVLRNSTDYSNALTLIPHYPVCDEAMSLLLTLDAPGTTAGGDGEVHARARRAITATFPTSVSKAESRMGATVRRRVKELAAAFPEHARPLDGRGRPAELDLVAAFAWELPLRVICDVLGLPAERYPDVKAWSEDQISLVWGRLDDAEQVRCARGLLNLWSLCQELVAERKRARADDMASRLIDWRGKAGETLSDKETASVLLNFAVAGHETTANAIATGLYHLLSHPELWRRAGERPEDVPGMAEELLRLYTPIIGWSRLTTREVTVSGVAIPANERVLMLLGAANRDGRVFPRPDDFEPGRAGDHLSFGLGIHYCVGAPLARLELTEALRELASLYPDMRPRPGLDDTTVRFKPNIGFHALRELPVVADFSPRLAAAPGGDR